MDIDLDFNSVDDVDLWEKDRLLRIGQFIKTEREAQHLTHEALSEKAGGTPAGGTISRIERAQTNVKRDTLLKILKALRHPPETLDKLSQHTMIPGTVVFQGMIRILYGIHEQKSIPTTHVNDQGKMAKVPLRAWVRENWQDSVFNELPLGSAGYDQIWELLEEHRYVEPSGSGDYHYASPSEDEITKMGMLFQGSIFMLIELLFESANEHDRRQSGAMLQHIAQQFERCSLSPELAKLALKKYFLYLSKGVPSYTSVMLQFLFIWDHILDKEAYKSFGGTPGSEEVGRGLLLYQARIKCIHFTLMEYGYLVANPGHFDAMQEKLAEIQTKYDTYVEGISRPGALHDVLKTLQPPYRPNFRVHIADDGSGKSPLEQVRKSIPALQSIPDDFLIVSTIDARGENPQHGVTTTSPDDLTTCSTFGESIDPLLGFQVDSTLGSAHLSESHVDYGTEITSCDDAVIETDDAESNDKA